MNDKELAIGSLDDPSLLPDMKLHFLGYGSGYNPKLGSNSAYMKLPGDGMLLLECGESVFRTLLGVRYFNKIKYLTIVLSHTHSDHSGSLGTLVPYVYRRTGTPVNIIYGNIRQRRELQGLLDNFGVPPMHYRLISVRRANAINLERRVELFGGAPLFIEMMKTHHAPELACFSILIMQMTDDTPSQIFWSGDTDDFLPAIAMLQTFPNCHIYHEANTSHSISHTDMDEFNEALLTFADDDIRLADKWRKRITLMHLNSDAACRHATKLGYSVPRIGR